MGEVVSISFLVPGRPVPFARAGSNGKRRYTPPKQAAYMSAVAAAARLEMKLAGMKAPFDAGLPLEMAYQAIYEIPKSWSRAERAAAFWKTSAPDADNLYKLAADALKNVVFVDDAPVARQRAEKLYGLHSGARITVSILAAKRAA